MDGPANMYLAPHPIPHQVVLILFWKALFYIDH